LLASFQRTNLNSNDDETLASSIKQGVLYTIALAVDLISTIDIYNKLVAARGKFKNKSIFNVHHVDVIFFKLMIFFHF
jgi:hypothetical protein